MFKEKFLINQRPGGKNRAFNLLNKALQSAKQKMKGGSGLEAQAQPDLQSPPERQTLSEAVEAPDYKPILNNVLFGTPDLPPNLNDWAQWNGESSPNNGGLIAKWTKLLRSNEQTEEFKAELAQRIRNIQNSYESAESFTDAELEEFITQMEAVLSSSEI